MRKKEDEKKDDGPPKKVINIKIRLQDFSKKRPLHQLHHVIKI